MTGPRGYYDESLPPSILTPEPPPVPDPEQAPPPPPPAPKRYSEPAQDTGALDDRP